MDVGSYGHNSDGGVYDSSSLKAALDEGSLKIPSPMLLPGTSTKIPHYFIGDGAFPIGPHLMKPFQGASLTHERAIFNYR